MHNIWQRAGIYYLIFPIVLIISGCHQSPAIFHRILDAPQTQYASPVPAPPYISDTTPVIAESPQPHQIKSGMPLTIGPGYTCVILARKQLDFLHAAPIAHAKLTCENSAYEIDSPTGDTFTKFFMAIDDPAVLSHSNNRPITLNTLNAMVQSVPHECQIIVDILPDSSGDDAVPGRKLSLLLSNYVIADKANILCDQAVRITNYVIPYVLG